MADVENFRAGTMSRTELSRKLKKLRKGVDDFSRDESDSDASGNFLGTSARSLALLNGKALMGNYQAIEKQVPGQSILPMIKADGYGHGSAWVARMLARERSLYGFGVATLKEGSRLRKELGPQHRRVRIHVFSDTSPWSDEKGAYCEKHGLTPIIATDRDWQVFTRDGWDEKVPYELLFNTGLNRLGISLNLAPKIAQSLRKAPGTAHPSGICSHLAIAESPESRLSQSQLEKFIWLRQELKGAAPSAHFHLGNSAGIWNQKAYGLSGLTDVVRPGISLYGVPPWAGAPERGLTPVMTLKASVLAVHCLKPGESIGYGGTFTVKGTKPVFAAILGVGYADGVSRALSNNGHVWIHDTASRFIGIVSMDLSAVSCPKETRVGEWCEILGPKVDIWAQAKAANTIPYELLTSVSGRVQRVYD